MIRYYDSDFDRGKETWVSTSGYTMSLGSGFVSWRSCIQTILADSTTKGDVGFNLVQKLYAKEFLRMENK